MSALDKVIKAAKKAGPFYSKLDEAFEALTRGKGTGQEFLTELTKQPGVKKAEIADRRLAEALGKQPKMTKQEAAAILKKNPPPKIEETTNRFVDELDEEDALDKLARYHYAEDYASLQRDEKDEILQELIDNMNIGEPAYADWATPGGEDYREILLRLPKKEKQETQEWFDPVTRPQSYYSSHWDEPNVLAHARVSDFYSPDRKRYLLIDEIQSDWHQAGRKHGYVDPKKRQDILNSMEQARQAHRDFLESMKQKYGNPNDGLQYVKSMLPEEREMARKLANEPERIRQEMSSSQDQVPDAPFKKNWHELAMKRLLNYAADNHYHGVAILPGEQQAARYSLSKQIDELHYNPDTHRLVAKNQGRQLIDERSVPPNRLADFIGNEAAQKIMEQEPSINGLRSLSGQELVVGGEGMKGFYDKILPDYLNSLGKPYGAEVRPGVLAKPDYHVIKNNAAKHFGEGSEAYNQALKNAGIDVHLFDLPPELSGEIRAKGLPLYQQIGIPAGAAGTQMDLGEEPGYAAGGPIEDPDSFDPDMSDGGKIIPAQPYKKGGKVRFSNNPDTMRLELLTRK